MNLIPLYILFCSFHINQIQNAPTSKSTQIDEFIVQLMTSDKFNELADIIAERAAKKIKYLSNKNSTIRHRSKTEKKEGNKKSITKKSNVHEIHESTLKQRKAEEKSSKFGRINTKAFLKHDPSSRELLLNYKHMTEGNAMKPNKMKKVEETKQEDEKSEYKENLLDDRSSESKSNSNEKPIIADSASSERENVKDKSKTDEYITKPPSVKKESVSTRGDEYKNGDPTPTTNEKQKSFSDEHFQENNDNTTTPAMNDDSSSDTEIMENVTNKKFDDIVDTSKEIVEVGLEPVDRKPSETSNQQTLVKLESSDETKPRETRVIRRENGKLYTYLSSPDYDEYHETARNKQLSKNSFINTYK